MTAQVLSGLAGAILSLIFSYLPGAAPWFDTLTPTQRRLTMAGLMLAVTVVVMTWKCNLQTECLTASWQDYLTVYASALVANQTIFQVSPQPVKK